MSTKKTAQPALQLDPRFSDMLETERKALKRRYKNVKKGKEIAAARLIEQAARCKVLLDLGFEDLSQNGDTELFSQSPTTPPYERERPAARLYVSREKNYMALLKQLDSLAVEEVQQSEPDALEMFLR